MDNSREIERLYRLDYGQVGEFWFRMVGTFIGAGIIWLYTGWILAWIWVGGYAGLQLIFFFYLRSKLKKATQAEVVFAHIIFPLLLASFVWMPVLMITSSDDVLSFSGFTILSGVIVFLVRRSEEYLHMMLFEIAILALFLAAGGAFILARYEDPIAWLGLTFGMATLIFYVTQASFIVRRERLRADEIAARTRQAEKLEAIGKLAGGVAHDFNNLLTVIIGNLDLARVLDDPRTQTELLDDARSAALRGATVVRQLLAYARQGDGTPHILGIRELMLATEAMCRTFVPERISLSFVVPASSIKVNVDEPLFITAMLNLVKNGVDAIAGPGEIEIRFDALHFALPQKCHGGQLLAAGDFIKFSVKDNGVGIPDSALERVADPFFTTKGVGKGSGLGLSMVAGFAVQSGGGLQIRSDSLGTVVSVFLPVAKSQQ